MATVLTVTSTAGSPECKYTLSMTPSSRTANSVYVSWSLTASLGSANSTMGFGLNATVYAGSDYQTKTLKGGETWSGTSPHTISGGFTVDGLSKTTTSISTALAVSIGTPAGYGACTLGKTSGNNLSISAWTSYTVSYNANGGSGAPASQTKWKDETLNLSSTIPTKTGYTFKGWALSKADADEGTWYYQAGGTCGKNEDLTLYAVWAENVLTVNYYRNNATYAAYKGEEVTTDLVHSQEFLYDNAANTGLADVQNTDYVYISRIGYTPTGDWGTSANGGTLVNEKTTFNTGQALAQAFGKSLANGNASVNLYPQWEINTYTFKYNANGGSGSMDSQSITWNSAFTFSENTFKREGYKFIGWYAHRDKDDTWFALGQTWLTEDEIIANGYEKKLYDTQTEYTFNSSWIRGDENSISDYTMYAAWEISGVIYIDNGTTFEPYLTYIDNGTGWDLYLAYVDDGTNWNIIS